jgi:hypothetical protein
MQLSNLWKLIVGLKEVIIITLAIVAISISLLLEHNQNIKNRAENKKRCYAERNREIDGIVADAFLNDDINVKAFVIYFTNGQKYVTPFFVKSLNGHVAPGDSIHKAAGTFKFEIYKKQNDRPFIFEDSVNCENW